MQYFLTDKELDRFTSGLKVATSIPFIDDIEDYIVEAIWEHAKGIDGIDPFYNIRSKLLYDVVDTKTKMGWSVKSLQWAVHPNCEFELVIQRADVFKKAEALGFEKLDSNSDPNLIGAALLKHWALKVHGDARQQDVQSKRIMVCLKSLDKSTYTILEEDVKIYAPADLYWKWTNASKNGLQGIRKSDNVMVYRWYPSQKQFFERFVLPETVQTVKITPTRLTKDQVVEILLPHL